MPENVIAFPDKVAVVKSLAEGWFQIYSALKDAGFSDDHAIGLLHRVIDGLGDE